MISESNTDILFNIEIGASLFLWIFLIWVSICDASASDLAGEIVAALSASSMVFEEDKDYSSPWTFEVVFL